jgi:hypothetical protein
MPFAPSNFPNSDNPSAKMQSALQLVMMQMRSRSHRVAGEFISVLNERDTARELEGFTPVECAEC